MPFSFICINCLDMVIQETYELVYMLILTHVLHIVLPHAHGNYKLLESL